MHEPGHAGHLFGDMFSNQKRLALKFCEDLSNFQPVNSDLRPSRAFLDDVRIKQPTLKPKSVNILNGLAYVLYTLHDVVVFPRVAVVLLYACYI